MPLDLGEFWRWLDTPGLGWIKAGLGWTRRDMRAEIIRRAKSGLLDDDELQLVITEQIEEDPSFWTGTGKSRTVINVEVNDGHVTLKGVVRSPVERRRADILARALGAAGVENLLRVIDDSSPDKRGKRVA